MDHVSLSKFLSLVLRHEPGKIGLTLDAQGWASVRELIDKANVKGKRFTHAELMEVVATSDKKRFTLSPDKMRIRAAQGHSIEVDLQLPPKEPPETLFHGTAQASVASIKAYGLKPMTRRQVHLSLDAETARKVGARHGRPAILIVASGAMHRAGHVFSQAENGVWLTDAVPPEFLTEAKS